MPVLCVNVDHVATLRQARREEQPDPVQAAVVCELAGAAGITIHVREDRRHIQDHDAHRMKRVIHTPLNLELATSDDMVKFALELHPHQATFVPEKREEVTTEGGLDVVGQYEKVRSAVERVQKAGIVASLFIDADTAQVQASAKSGARMVEFHTGRYCRAMDQGQNTEALRELKALTDASALAQSLGIIVNAGHGLNLRNVGPVAAIPGMHELNIGHSIIARAVYVGLDRAVREMIDAMATAVAAARK